MTKQKNPPIRIVAKSLRRKADEYMKADEIDREELSAILNAAAHLIDSMYAEKDAQSERKSAEAAIRAFRKHEKDQPDRDKARRWFDEWQDPKHRRVFRTDADFAHYVVAHTKFTSVEYWSKKPSQWRKESA